MSLTFNEAIDATLAKIKLSESDHKAFVDDVEIISNKILETLKKKGSIFQNMFEKLSTVAHYSKGNQYDLVDDYENILLYKIPFKVHVLFHPADSQGLRLKTRVNHPIVDNGFVNCDLFTFLLEKNLEIEIPKINRISCSNDKVYKLSYERLANNYFKIEANEEVGDGVSPNQIVFLFFVGFEFSLEEFPLPENVEFPKFGNVTSNYWIAMSLTGNIFGRTDILLNSAFSLEVSRKIRETTCLFLCANGNGILYMPLTFNLDLMKLANAKDISVGSSLIHTIRTFFLYANNILKSEEIVDKIKKMLNDLEYYQKLNSVNLDDFLEIFGLKNE